MDEVAPEDAAPTEAPPSQLFPLGLRILVVDDDPVCLSAVEKMLRRCGYAGARARPHPFCHSPPLKLRDGTENRHYFYGDYSDSLRHRARSDDGKQRRRCACDYSEQCGMFWCAIAPLAGTRDIMPIHRGSLRQTQFPRRPGTQRRVHARHRWPAAHGTHRPGDGRARHQCVPRGPHIRDPGLGG